MRNFGGIALNNFGPFYSFVLFSQPFSTIFVSLKKVNRQKELELELELELKTNLKRFISLKKFVSIPYMALLALSSK